MPSETPLPGTCGEFGGTARHSIEKYGKIMYCTNKAGKGTDHKGTGRCRNHGGCSKGRPSIKTSIQKIKRQLVPEELEEFSELDPAEQLDLTLELHAGKKLFVDIRDQLKNIPLDSENLSVYDMLLRVGKYNKDLIDTLYKTKYMGLSKVQIQVFHNFVKLVYYRLVTDERFPELRNSEKTKAIREIIESSAQDAISGGGSSVETEYSVI